MEVTALKDSLAAVLKRGAVTDWEVEAIKEWWALHSEHIHGHHHNEDDIMNPFLRSRINLPDKLEADHKILLAHMDKLSDAANALTEGNKATVEALQALWHECAYSMPLHRAASYHTALRRTLHTHADTLLPPVHSHRHALTHQPCRSQPFESRGVGAIIHVLLST